MAFAVAVAAFVGIALLSVPLVHLLQRGAGADRPTGVEQAWFQHPIAVARGVPSGANVAVVVVPIRSGSIRWLVSGQDRVVALGSVVGHPGRATSFVVATSRLMAGTLASIEVEGLSVPLSFRVVMR